MRHLTSLICAILIVHVGKINSIIWNEEPGNSWSYSCIFPQDPKTDLKRIYSEPRMCSFQCRMTPGCTHYFWSSTIGFLSACTLRGDSKITKANAIDVQNQAFFCGILTPGNLKI